MKKKNADELESQNGNLYIAYVELIPHSCTSKNASATEVLQKVVMAGCPKN